MYVCVPFITQRTSDKYLIIKDNDVKEHSYYNNYDAKIPFIFGFHIKDKKNWIVSLHSYASFIHIYSSFKKYRVFNFAWCSIFCGVVKTFRKLFFFVEKQFVIHHGYPHRVSSLSIIVKVNRNKALLLRKIFFKKFLYGSPLEATYKFSFLFLLYFWIKWTVKKWENYNVEKLFQ